MSRVWITGTGAVGPFGLGLPEGLPASLPAGGSETFRLVSGNLPLKEGFPPGAMRWLDASSLWWINAARQALGDGAIAPDVPPDSPKTAQVVGLGWGSTPPVLALVEQIRDEGYAGMAPALFPYSVGNAPAAQAGILLGLKGAAITLTAKEAGGLAAVVEGIRLVEGGLAGACVAGGVDQADPFIQRVLRAMRRGARMPAGEGAYALKLQGCSEPPPGALARVASRITRSTPCPAHHFPEGGPLLEAVSEDLLARAGWERDRVDLVVLPTDRPDLERASRSLAERLFPSAASLRFQDSLGACGASWAGAAGLAAREIARGRARCALLVALATGGCAWGLALERAHAK